MRLAQPLTQLGLLLPEYDELRESGQDHRQTRQSTAEEGRSRAGVCAPLKGRIEFREVRFRYFGAAAPALDNVSFTVPEGTIFGIMGRSGSGKTTVTRLRSFCIPITRG